MALALAVSQGLALDVPQHLAASAQVPEVGTTPPGFVGYLENYTHAMILELIIFYNEDFSIVDSDDITTRIAKFRAFLTDF